MALDSIQQTITEYINRTSLIIDKIGGVDRLLTIVAIIVAILVPLIIWKNGVNKNKQKSRKAFKDGKLWFSSKKIKYSDFDTNRKQHEEEICLSVFSELPTQIDNLLKESKSLLLIARRNAGKTHFMVNYLKSLKHTQILIPNIDKFNNSYNSIFPKCKRPFTKKHKKIVIIDDAYTYKKSADYTKIKDFVNEAISLDYVVWMNTVDDEYENTEEIFSDKTLNNRFEKITIRDLPRTEIREIVYKNNKDVDIIPEYHFGSIGNILNPKDIRKAYSNIEEYTTEKKILKRIKQLYLMGFYEVPFRVKKDNILKFGFSESKKELLDSIKKLRQDGFLFHSKDKASIGFEEIYMIEIVYPEMQVKDFMEEFSIHFPDNPAAYTQAMGNSNYDKAIEIFNKMKVNGMTLNSRPFAVLIRKSEDTDKGLQWLDELDKHCSEPPNEYIIRNLFRTTDDDPEKIAKVYEELTRRYVNLIPIIEEGRKIYLDGNKRYDYHRLMKSAKYYKCLQLFNEMKSAGIKANSATYCILISKTDYPTAKQLFKEMESIGIDPTCAIYSNLINVSKDFEIGMSILKNIEETKNPPPDKYIYGAVMKFAPNYPEADNLFHKMLLENIAIDSGAYGTLIQKADFNKGRELLSQWKDNEKHKKHLDNSVYGTLMSNAPDYHIAREIFKEMINNKLTPTSWEYATLIKKSGNTNDGRELLVEMEKEGVTINVEIYQTLIYVSSDYATGRLFFDEWTSKENDLDKGCYATLISKCNTEEYLIAKSLFDEMIEKFDDGVDAQAYVTLMKIASNPNDIIEVFYKIREKKVELTPKTYGPLIGMIQDYAVIKELFDEMQIRGFKPDQGIYLSLINKCGNPLEANQLFKEMKQKEFKANTETYGYLIKINPLDIGSKLYNEMFDEKIPVNHVIYATLINKNLDFTERKRWFDKMVDHLGFPKDDQGAYGSLFIKNKKIYNYNYADCLSVYNKMIHQEGIIPNEKTYSHLIRSSRTTKEREYIIQEMKDHGVPLGNYSYVSLIQKAKDYPAGKILFDEMCQKGILENLSKEDAMFAFNTLLQKCKDTDYPLAYAIVNYEMPKYNLTPNDYTNKLLSRISPSSDIFY